MHVDSIGAWGNLPEISLSITLGLLAGVGCTPALVGHQGACAGGEAEGCAKLGDTYEQGRGVPKDLAHAAQLFKQACDGGDARGCTNLGVMYYKGEGVPRDLARAAELYKQACNGGDALGCTNLGVMYYKGQGVAKDLARARELYQRACDGGNALGCAKLSIMYAYGYEVPKDLIRAAQLLKRACDGGDADSCMSLAFRHMLGEGVPKDLTRAAQLFKQGCDAGAADGCVDLGAMYHEGEGVARDTDRAMQLFKQGCEGGDADGCAFLRTDRAVQPFKQGCDGGNAAACASSKGSTGGGTGTVGATRANEPVDSWAQWPMPNSQADVTAGAPNLESYTDNGDGTVTDNVTSLMWQKAVPLDTYTWTDAAAYCRRLTLAGHSDWRLPSIIELYSIVDLGQNGSINGTYFPSTPLNQYWSSSPVAGGPDGAWHVWFGFGGASYRFVHFASNVRCLR
jgi:TPR repeat protein